MFSHFHGDVYLSLGISLSCLVFFVSFLTVPELFCDENLDILAILLQTLLPMKLSVAPAILFITFLEIVLSTCVADCLA